MPIIARRRWCNLAIEVDIEIEAIEQRMHTDLESSSSWLKVSQRSI